MGTNRTLSAAKSAKNDEFYTQYPDIQKEVNAYLDFDPNVFRGKVVLLPCDDPEWSNFTRFFAQNFQRFGLKKLISTSYAPTAKCAKYDKDLPLFAYAEEQNGAKPDNARGKIFVLDHDTNANGRIDFEDLEWSYLQGDGDFRSAEVRVLRDEADIIVTNPPFSLFREFLAWIVDANKKFLILGNKNALKYKEVFPLIKGNKMWSGRTEWSGGMWFKTIDDNDVDRVVDGVKMKNVASVWFTNIEHGRRHEPLMLMTEKENIKYSKHKDVRGIGYRHYVNYDAIEVPYTDAIPSDYSGIMGVPITFMEKYCPDQFEIIGMSLDLANMDVVRERLGRNDGGPTFYVEIDGELMRLYDRIAIRHRRSGVNADERSDGGTRSCASASDSAKGPAK